MQLRDEHRADVQPRPIGRPLSHCPECGSAELDPVIELETQDVHFLCCNCGRCWHVELGYVHRMAPSACGGCPERARCETVYAADHPRA